MGYDSGMTPGAAVEKRSSKARGGTAREVVGAKDRDLTGRPRSAPAKRKISLSLDADIVEELERDGSLSAQVNAALRVELERRHRQAALGALLDRLDREDGPLDTPEDAAAIERFKELLA